MMSFSLDRMGVFATAPDVPSEPELSEKVRNLGVIVAFVEAHALRGSRTEDGGAEAVKG
jgi:hypothetical protein